MPPLTPRHLPRILTTQLKALPSEVDKAVTAATEVAALLLGALGAAAAI